MMTMLAIQGVLWEITRWMVHSTDELLRPAIRLLTTTPAPLVDVARLGAFVAFILLIVGLFGRYLLGETGSLTVDAEHGWTRGDTTRMVTAFAGFSIYYLHLDTAYSVFGRMTASLGGGEAIIAAMQVPLIDGGGSLINLLLALASAQMVLMTTLLGLVRTLIIMGVLPAVLPVLTVGVLLRIPSLSSLSREMLRSLRWVVYAGIVAVFAIQTGGLVTAATSSMGLPLVSLFVALVTLNLTAVAMLHTFSRGPEIERRIECALCASSNPDAPHHPDDNGADEDRVKTEDGEMERTAENSVKLV